MNRFISKIIIFLTLLVVVIFSMNLFFRCIEMKMNYNIAPKGSVAVIGHSHVQTSVNDSLLSQKISKNVKNYGVSGQSMFWTIIGARKLKHQGTKHFIIELSNSSYFTGWKATDQKRGLQESSKVYFLKPNELINLFAKDFVFTTKLLLKEPFPKKKVRGKYVKHKFSFTKDIVKENDEDVFIQDFNDKIIHEFIKSNDSLSFVIFRAPQHPEYYNYLGGEDEKKFIKNLNSFDKYKNCRVLDFGHTYKSDSLFADLEHMNYKGAAIFSELLADSLMNIQEYDKN
jgi:hypothetical protein